MLLKTLTPPSQPGLPLREQRCFQRQGALFWLKKEDFEEAGADSSAVDGVVNMLQITGVKVALFMTGVNGENKVSIRTKAPFVARGYPYLPAEVPYPGSRSKDRRQFSGGTRICKGRGGKIY